MAKTKAINKTTNKKISANASNKTSPKKIIGASVLAGLVGLAGFGIGQAVQDKHDTGDSSYFAPVYSVSQSELNSAKNLLGRLPVTSRIQDLPDYDSKTMPSWADIDSDGCVTRYDVLERDLLNGETDAGNCQIRGGAFFDYYTGNLIKYNSAIPGGGVDIDHIVAKEDAWNSGGFDWSAEQWQKYVNDEDLLIATSASANRQKGGKNAAEWLPQNTEFHCRYAIMQIQIKYKYQLSVSGDEKLTFRNILNNICIVSE